MKKIIVSVTIEETNDYQLMLRWHSRAKTERFVVENIANDADIATVCEETQVATYNLVEDLLKEFAHGSQ